MVAQVRTKVEAAENCLGNAVVTSESSEEQEANLQKAMQDILRVGSPIEYI